MDSDNKKPVEIKPEDGGPTIQKQPLKNRLRSLMTAKSAKVKDVALATNVSASTVFKWLDASRVPTIVQVEKLDAFFDSTLTDEYKDVFREGSAGQRVCRVTALEPDQEAEAMDPPPQLGEKIGVEDRNNRQVAMAIISKALDCLRLVLARPA